MSYLQQYMVILVQFGGQQWWRMMSSFHPSVLMIDFVAFYFTQNLVLS